MLRLICLSILLFSTSLFANSEDHRSIEYSEINSMVSIFKTKVRSKLVSMSAHLSIKDESIDPKSVKLWLTKGDDFLNDISIHFNEVNKQYQFDLPTFTEDVAESILLHINQKKDAVGISIATGLGDLKEKQISYYDLFILLDDINDFASEMAGAASWFLPEMEELKFTFDEPATITVKQENKIKTYSTNDDLEIQIEKNKKLMKSNPMVEFSHLPARITPED